MPVPDDTSATCPVAMTAPATEPPVIPSSLPPVVAWLNSATPSTTGCPDGPGAAAPEPCGVPGNPPTVYGVANVNFCDAPEPTKPLVLSADCVISAAHPCVGVAEAVCTPIFTAPIVNPGSTTTAITYKVPEVSVPFDTMSVRSKFSRRSALPFSA